MLINLIYFANLSISGFLRFSRIRRLNRMLNACLCCNHCHWVQFLIDLWFFRGYPGNRFSLDSSTFFLFIVEISLWGRTYRGVQTSVMLSTLQTFSLGYGNVWRSLSHSNSLAAILLKIILFKRFFRSLASLQSKCGVAVQGLRRWFRFFFFPIIYFKIFFHKC